ncbi:MAG: DNA methyltransferase [Chloroflexota bacterium]|nr:DNA methyltransferase [Chloroflexota bacterium]
MTSTSEGSSLNFASGTIWTGDCLEVMRGINSETIDLIYLDPPFNSNANYAAPVGSQAAGAAFKDTWTLSDVDAEWINLIEQKHPAVHRVLLAAMTNSDKSYLAYMAARLLEMPRLLKPTGSIYLHCDPTMSHYLKLLMDAVFGRRNFKNEITWKRTSSRSDAKRYGRIHDTLLYYVRGSEATWNGAWEPHDEEYVNRFYRHSDESGRRYMLDNMASPNPRPNMTYTWRGFPPPEKGWRFERETMQRLHDEGRIWYPPSTDRRPRLKRYLDEQQGRAAGDVITDINPIGAQAKERLGYPTQKPLALLERVIKASSNEGDMVLDPFCGCATTLVAADRLDRQWVGMDLSAKAAELVVQRVEAEQGLWKNIIHRADIPQRDDLGPLPAYNSPANKQQLYGQQGGDCAGCGTHFQPQHLTVDHIIAQSKGGTDHLDNLQLLCAHCNSVKGDRGMEYLRAKLQLHPA